MAHLGKVNKSRIRFSLVTLNAASILNLTTLHIPGRNSFSCTEKNLKFCHGN